MAGQAEGGSSVGVIGLYKAENKNSKSTDNGSGILGATEAGKGFGVVGLSVDTLVLTSPTTVPKPARETSGGFSSAGSGGGTGVLGASGTGIGVLGVSASGDGVFGLSEGDGYGGHFSGKRAPLRLQPADISGRPTTGNHQRGELFVDKNGDLFFCTGDGRPGTWSRVQLTPA